MKYTVARHGGMPRPAVLTVQSVYYTILDPGEQGLGSTQRSFYLKALDSKKHRRKFLPYHLPSQDWRPRREISVIELMRVWKHIPTTHDHLPLPEFIRTASILWGDRTDTTENTISFLMEELLNPARDSYIKSSKTL